MHTRALGVSHSLPEEPGFAIPLGQHCAHCAVHIRTGDRVPGPDPLEPGVGRSHAPAPHHRLRHPGAVRLEITQHPWVVPDTQQLEKVLGSHAGIDTAACGTAGCAWPGSGMESRRPVQLPGVLGHDHPSEPGPTPHPAACVALAQAQDQLSNTLHRGTAQLSALRGAWRSRGWRRGSSPSGCWS